MIKAGRNLVQMPRFNSHIRIGNEWDIDAIKFITSTNLSGFKAQVINTLVTDLKQYGIWPLLKECYPLISCDTDTTSGTLRWNTCASLINPSFASGINGPRAEIVGTPTLSTTGININGSSSNRMATFFYPFVSLQNMNNHAAVYSRTNNTATGAFYGLLTSVGSPPYFLFDVISGPSFRILDHAQSYTTSAVDTSGFFIVSRVSNLDLRLYRNGTQLGSTFTTVATGNLPTGNSLNRGVFIGANNLGNNTENVPSNREIAYVSFGDGLDATQASNYNTIIQKYQSLLNRAV